jgi:hypothetical protein
VSARFKDVCLDAGDNSRVADWWCRALGYVRRDADLDPHDPICIVDPSGSGPAIWINEVPEAKVVKNRMHLDVIGTTEELLGMGATLLRAHDAEIDWDILADIEGNEFCVFPPRDA